MPDKLVHERRVYLLSEPLVARVQQYQRDHKLASEVEAARALLNAALEASDTAASLLERMKKAQGTRRNVDLRRIAADVLGAHRALASIVFEIGQVTFTMKNGERGVFRADGASRVEMVGA